MSEVYFIATPDRTRVKIGFSKKAALRVKGILAQCPINLDVLAVVPGTIQDERALHGLFLHNHIRNEWFSGTAELLATIAAIQSLGSIPYQLRGGPDQPVGIKQDFSFRSAPEWRAANSARQKLRWAGRRAAKLRAA